MLNLRLPDSCYISPLGFAVGDLLHLKPSHLAKFQGEALGTIRDPTVQNPGNNGVVSYYHIISYHHDNSVSAKEVTVVD